MSIGGENSRLEFFNQGKGEMSDKQNGLKPPEDLDKKEREEITNKTVQMHNVKKGLRAIDREKKLFVSEEKEDKFERLNAVLDFLAASEKSFIDYVRELKDDPEFRDKSMILSPFRLALFRRIASDAGVDVSDFLEEHLRYLSVNYDPYKELCKKVLNISVEYKRSA